MLTPPNRIALPAVIVVTLLLGALPISAQDSASRVFLRYTGTDAQVAALEGARLRFEREIHRASEVQFAGTTEMDAVYADCREAVGVGSSEERECQLQAARRIFVEHVIDVGIGRVRRGQYELTIETWDPDANTRVHGDFVEVEADTLDEAARAGMGLLAHSYLCSIGVRASCHVNAAAQSPDAVAPASPAAALSGGEGRLVIEDVRPAPVSVLVNGVLIGQGPGEFDGLPTGEVELTLTADGYEDASSVVALSGFQVYQLTGVSLEPLSLGRLVIEDVQPEHVEVRVNGQLLGQGPGEFGELPIGPVEVTLSAEGFRDSSSNIVLLAHELVRLSDVRLRQSAPDGFVFIEAGTFMMGSPASEADRHDNEVQHEVTLTHGFFMHSHEVTQAEWATLMVENRHSQSQPTEPMSYANWYEALAYANALSVAQGLPACYTLLGCDDDVPGDDMHCEGVEVNADGRSPYLCQGYRLPTEAEWEYAARAGTMTTWICGSDESCLDQHAWYGYAPGHMPHPGAQKLPNDWGLYDMSGNTSEWIWDECRPLPSGSMADPTFSGGFERRAFRGGNVYDDPDDLRVANRSCFDPTDSSDNHRRIGFRLARTAL